MNYKELALQLMQTSLKLSARIERRKKALQKFKLLDRIFVYDRFSNSRQKIKELESARLQMVGMMLAATRRARKKRAK